MRASMTSAVASGRHLEKSSRADDAVLDVDALFEHGPLQQHAVHHLDIVPHLAPRAQNAALYGGSVPDAGAPSNLSTALRQAAQANEGCCSMENRHDMRVRRP